MKHSIVVALLCILAPIVSYGQNYYTISGKITNQNTGKPLFGATVIYNSKVTTTDTNGLFEFEKITYGKHNIKISHIGFSSATSQIIIEKDTYLEFSLKESVTNLNEVTVHGTKEERKTKSNATNTTYVNSDFLIKNRSNSLMQTLEKLPGITTINIGATQSKPVIRGLGFNRVVVAQNGIKHEAQQWGSDHGLEIDQYGLENIEIVKGPSALLFGSDAIAGVINILPADVPQKKSFSGEVNLLTETNNDLYGVAMNIKNRPGSWYYNLSLNFKQYGDHKVPTDEIKYDNYVFKLHNNDLRNTAGKENAISLSVGHISEKLKTETYISNVQAKNGFFANAHGQEVRLSEIDYDSNNRDIDLPYHNVNHFKVTNNSTFFGAKNVTKLELGFQNNKREEHSEPVPHGYMPKPNSTKERQFNKNTYSLNLQNTYKGFNNHKITTGFNLENQNNKIGGWGFLIPTFTNLSSGLFLFDHIKLSDKLYAQAGIRYDYGLLKTKEYREWFLSPNENNEQEYRKLSDAKSLSYNNYSAAAGISYTPNRTTYKLHLGKSFRMPLANELASDGVNYHMYRYEKGNINLNPEESYQLDIEIFHKAEKYSFSASPFFNYFGNFIYLNPTPNYQESLQIYEYTQSKVFRWGGELTAHYQINNNLEVDASLEYVYAEQLNGTKKGFTLPFSPPLSSLFSITYTPKDIGKLTKPEFGINYKVTAKQNSIVPPERRTNGYQLVNLNISSGLKIFKNQDPIKLQLKANNVLNTKYFNHTSFYRLIEVPEPGRNFSLSATISLEKNN